MATRKIHEENLVPIFLIHMYMQTQVHRKMVDHSPTPQHLKYAFNTHVFYISNGRYPTVRRWHATPNTSRLGRVGGLTWWQGAGRWPQ